MVPKLLAPHNLVQKEISGQKIKVKDLLPYFKCYMDLFSGDELPEPKSMLVVRWFSPIICQRLFLSLRLFYEFDSLLRSFSLLK